MLPPPEHVLSQTDERFQEVLDHNSKLCVSHPFYSHSSSLIRLHSRWWYVKCITIILVSGSTDFRSPEFQTSLHDCHEMSIAIGVTLGSALLISIVAIVCLICRWKHDIFISVSIQYIIAACQPLCGSFVELTDFNRYYTYSSYKVGY